MHWRAGSAQSRSSACWGAGGTTPVKGSLSVPATPDLPMQAAMQASEGCLEQGTDVCMSAEPRQQVVQIGQRHHRMHAGAAVITWLLCTSRGGSLALATSNKGCQQVTPQSKQTRQQVVVREVRDLPGVPARVVAVAVGREQRTAGGRRGRGGRAGSEAAGQHAHASHALAPPRMHKLVAVGTGPPGH